MLEVLDVGAERLGANWERFYMSFIAPIDKCARVGVVSAQCIRRVGAFKLLKTFV